MSMVNVTFRSSPGMTAIGSGSGRSRKRRGMAVPGRNLPFGDFQRERGGGSVIDWTFDNVVSARASSEIKQRRGQAPCCTEQMKSKSGPRNHFYRISMIFELRALRFGGEIDKFGDLADELDAESILDRAHDRLIDQASQDPILLSVLFCGSLVR